MNKQELLYENYQKLPLALRGYLKEEEYKRQVGEWGDRFNLNQGQQEDLEYEILLILLGVISYDKFKERLKEINLDENLSDKLNQLIKTEIFNPWLDTLEKFKKEIEDDYKSITKFDSQDMEYSMEQIEEAFNKLPQDIKEYIQSIDLLKKVEMIGYGNKLHIDQIGALGEEVGYVILGLTKINNFLSRVEKRLQISPSLASNIVRDINENIFSPMKDSLRQIHNIGGPQKEEIEEIPPQPKKKEKGDNIFEQKMKKLFSRPPKEDSDEKIEKDGLPPPPLPNNDPYHEPI